MTSLFLEMNIILTVPRYELVSPTLNKLTHQSLNELIQTFNEPFL